MLTFSLSLFFPSPFPSHPVASSSLSPIPSSLHSSSPFPSHHITLSPLPLSLLSSSPSLQCLHPLVSSLLSRGRYLTHSFGIDSSRTKDSSPLVSPRPPNVGGGGPSLGPLFLRLAVHLHPGVSSCFLLLPPGPRPLHHR